MALDSLVRKVEYGFDIFLFVCAAKITDFVKKRVLLNSLQEVKRQKKSIKIFDSHESYRRFIDFYGENIDGDQIPTYYDSEGNVCVAQILPLAKRYKGYSIYKALEKFLKAKLEEINRKYF